MCAFHADRGPKIATALENSLRKVEVSPLHQVAFGLQGHLCISIWRIWFSLESSAAENVSSRLVIPSMANMNRSRSHFEVGRTWLCVVKLCGYYLAMAPRYLFHSLVQ